MKRIWYIPMITILFHTKNWKTIINPPFWCRVQSFHNFPLFIRQCNSFLRPFFARKNSVLYWKSLKVLKVFEHSKYEFIHHHDHYKNRFPAPGLRESSLRVYRGGEHTMTPTEKLARRLSPSDVLTLSNNFLCVTKWFTLQVLQHVSRCLD